MMSHTVTSQQPKTAPLNIVGHIWSTQTSRHTFAETWGLRSSRHGRIACSTYTPGPLRAAISIAYNTITATPQRRSRQNSKVREAHSVGKRKCLAFDTIFDFRVLTFLRYIGMEDMDISMYR